jgi:hypothetical protein
MRINARQDLVEQVGATMHITDCIDAHALRQARRRFGACPFQQSSDHLVSRAGISLQLQAFLRLTIIESNA